MSSNTFLEKIEILPGRLYFCTVPHKSPAVDENGQPTYAIKNKSSQFIYYCTDASLTYTAFFADFGPLNIGLTYNFCEQLDTYLTQSQVEKKPVIYYCSQHPHYRANSAVLICAYLIFVQGMTVEQAYAPFIGISPRLISSRDAAFCINSYPIFPLDCAKAFYRASQLNHFDYGTFDVQKHDQLAKLEHGDVSWIVPGKFIAFSGPVAQRREVGNGLYALSPEAYVPLFHSLGVTCVIRFNKKCYDRNIFTRGGIRHVDLFYEDGGNPTDDILQAFLRTCENETGAIAVHCKAGLGRTGTNIAAYMMKHYGYTAREASAWCRVCRPGSVVGPQQQYLETKQDQMWAEGRRYRQDGGVMRGPRMSAGRQRPGVSSTTTSVSRKQRPTMKSFDTIEESVTARLLSRIQQDADGGSLASSNNGALNDNNAMWEKSKGSGSNTSSNLRDKKKSARTLLSKSQQVENFSSQRPNTTENGRKSAERSGLKSQFEGGHVVRKNSRGAVSSSVNGLSSGSTSGLSSGGTSNGSTIQKQRSTDSGAGRRTVTTERRPNTSGGAASQRTLLSQRSAKNGGSSSSLRSGGGLKNMSSQSPSQGSGSSRSSATPSRASTSTSHSSRVGGKR